MYRRTAVLVSAPTPGACATAPMSSLHGQPRSQWPLDHDPVRIVSVDKSPQCQPTVLVGPGLREVVLEAAPGRGARSSTQKRFVLAVEPCTRYDLMASRKGPMDADGDLVVASKESVEGCDRQAGIEKALK